MKIVGTILLLLGFLIALFVGFQIATNDLVDFGPRQISNPDIVSIYWSPITAVALILSGIMALFIAKKERSVRHH